METTTRSTTRLASNASTVRRTLARHGFPALVAVAAVIAYAVLYLRGIAPGPPVRSDGEGYYAYLPSYLLYHDDSFRILLSQHLAPSVTHFPVSVFGFSLQPTGHYLDKYPVGEAMLVLPFFVAGHVVALIAGTGANGYSSIEEAAAGLAGLVYTVLGLLALAALLRRWFGDGVIAATLAVITFGTSVFHYATYDTMFSHAFAFFACALMLLCAMRWYESPTSRWRALCLGIAAGLVVAIRLTDVVLLLAIPLLDAGTSAALRERLHVVSRNWRHALIAAAAAAAMLVPQVVTWYLASRHLVVRAYQGENFDFAHPHLLGALFSFDPHGLLPYAPALILAVPGAVAGWRRRRGLVLPAVITFLPFWLLVAAWWDWSFTAGFGNRAFDDIIPLLALPIATLFAALRWRWLRAGVAVFATACTLATTLLMLEYWAGDLGPAGAPASRLPHLLLLPLLHLRL